MYDKGTLGQKVVPIQRCSFCGCGTDEADVLVAAERPGVYICDGCLALAVRTASGYAAKIARRLAKAASRKR